MRYFILSFFTLCIVNSYGQKKITKYLELRANIDMAGNIYINDVIKPRRMNKLDSLIDYKELRTIVKLLDPIKIIDRLAESGWSLVSTTQVTSDKENRPNSPFLLYYFRKEFSINE